MATLRITVAWLDGRYHGREWPPAPLRLYQALLAGAARPMRGERAFEAALRHLEALPPPEIVAPALDARSEVTAAVVHNDADAVLALHARGAPALARAQASRSRTRRIRRARHVAGAVAYEWRATTGTGGHFEPLARIARSLTALGLGIDLAVAHAALHDGAPPPVPGIRYTPTPGAARRLRVPWPGAFDALQSAYRADRVRIGADTVAGAAVVPVRTTGYASALEPAPVRIAAFALRDLNDRALCVEATRAVEVAAMVRHAVGGAARAAGLDPGVVAELMGHGGGDRIRIAPLPSVGHRHADGRIRRVLLTAPFGVAPDAWGEVVARLAGRALVPEHARLPMGMLAPLERGDAVLRMFRCEAVVWTTATPVVLPGRDHRRGRPRPHRALARLLRHAGVAQALLESATLEPAPRIAGCADAARYRRPRHLARYPVTHLSVTWCTAVAGPLALGAGAGCGLGLLVPAPDRVHPPLARAPG